MRSGKDNWRSRPTDRSDRTDLLPMAEAFWRDDFGIPVEDKAVFVQELKEWATSQGYKYVINSGKGR